MLKHFRNSRTTVLPSLDAFWAHVDSTQTAMATPDGAAADAEERLDLRMGKALKELLEERIGPEEGDEHVQMQNWDWNDDRTRPAFVLLYAFKPEVIPEIQSLLVGEFKAFRVLLLLQEDWNSDIWGGIVVSADRLVVQKNVAIRYTTSA